MGLLARPSKVFDDEPKATATAKTVCKEAATSKLIKTKTASGSKRPAEDDSKIAERVIERRERRVDTLTSSTETVKRKKAVSVVGGKSGLSTPLPAVEPKVAKARLCSFCSKGNEISAMAGNLVLVKGMKDGLFAHEDCMLWSPKIFMNKETKVMENVEKEIDRGKFLVRCFARNFAQFFCRNVLFVFNGELPSAAITDRADGVFTTNAPSRADACLTNRGVFLPDVPLLP